MPLTDQQNQILQTMRQRGASDKELDAMLGKWGYTRMSLVQELMGQQPAVVHNQPAQVQEQGTPWYDPSGLSRAAEQGLLFGFGDEINAGVRSLTDPRSYDELLKDERSINADYARQHPQANVLANVAGGIPYMFVPGLNAARGASALQLAANGLRTGAAMGAISGAGNADGDLLDRAKGAVTGGVLGGVLGAGIPAAMNRMGWLPQKVADATADAPGVSNAISHLPGVTAPGLGRSNQVLLDALRKDGVSLDQLLAHFEQMQKTGLPVTLADAAQDMGLRNTMGIVDAAAQVPSAGLTRAGTVLEERANEQGTRIANNLAKQTGVSRDAIQTAEEMMAQRAQAAAPLYQKAYEEGAQLNNPRLFDMFKLPAIQEAYKRALRIAANEGKALPDIAKGQPPSLELMDYVKRGLDDIIYSGKVGDSSIGRAERASVDGVRRELLGVLDEMVPTYSKARAVYAGPTKLLEALEEGKQFLTQDPRVLRRTFAELTPGERDHYLLGAVDEIKRRVSKAKDGADVYNLVFGDDNRRELLKAMFPSEESFNAFRNAMSVEKAMRDTNRFLTGNSRTMSRAANVAELGTMTPEMITDPKTALVNSIMSRAKGVVGKNAENVLDTMVNLNPQERAKALMQSQFQAGRRASRPMVTPTVGGVLGGLLGR